MNNINDISCPVCGYYCLGKGGYGCIDKPSMLNLNKEHTRKDENAMIGECMFNPPTMLLTKPVRPIVECTDWCHSCKNKDQTGGSCRRCQYFRVFNKEQMNEKS